MARVDVDSPKTHSFFCSLSISLNNVTGDAPPSPLSPETLSQKYSVSYLPQFAFSSDRKSSKRDLLDSSLRETFPGVRWSNKFWDFIDVYRDVAEGVFRIRNSSDSLYRRYEFENCYWVKARGRVHTRIDNPEERYRERYHCGEPGCLLCNDLSRRRLAFEWIVDYKQIVAANAGFTGILILEFTLPKELEVDPLYCKDLERKLLDGIQTIVRRLFCLKSRANIAMNICVHPVGSKNIFRDRWHAHVVITPAVIERDKKTGKKGFRWVEPVHVAPGHTQKLWKLDLLWLKNAWNEELSMAFDLISPGAIQPQVEFIPYSQGRKRREGQEYEKRFWGKAAHRLKYAMRSFAMDLENAVLKTDKENKRNVLKTTVDDIEYWGVVDTVTLVERYRFMKEKNIVSCRGWAQSKKLNSDFLGLIEDDPGMEPECLISDAVIEVIRRKIFDENRKELITERTEIWHFRCPVSHQDITLNERDMSPWKWNRKK